MILGVISVPKYGILLDHWYSLSYFGEENLRQSLTKWPLYFLYLIET